MKLAFLISVIQLLLGCDNPGKPSALENGGKSKNASAALSEDTTYMSGYLKEVFGDTVTITVSYAAIECGCPQWFETKFENEKFLEGVERFYLEPVGKDLVNGNRLWDGKHLPLTLQITGRFSKEKLMPVTYYTKGEPEKARIFWYHKINVVSP